MTGRIRASALVLFVFGSLFLATPAGGDHTGLRALQLQQRVVRVQLDAIVFTEGLAKLYPVDDSRTMSFEQL